jgi:DNA-binding CsgD family transcriptional regulator
MAPFPHGQSLTRRERQILKLVVEGCTNAPIAVRLHLRTQTVKNQLSVLMEKAGVKNRVKLAVYAVTLLVAVQGSLPVYPFLNSVAVRRVLSAHVYRGRRVRPSRRCFRRWRNSARFLVGQCGGRGLRGEPWNSLFDV